MPKLRLRDITATAMLTALAVIISYVFHTVQISGRIFLPMHIPVLLCGLICGSFWGGTCGVAAVLISSFATGMPPIYPTGVSMVLELMTYGIVSGWVLRALKSGKLVVRVCIAMVIAMLAGRAVMGIASYILLGIIGNGYTFKIFIASAFTIALPGIAIQLLLIPTLILALKKAKLLNYPPFTQKR